MLIKIIWFLLFAPFELVISPVLIILCILSRFRTKPIDVGLGPEPLINNVYHKQALEKKGYSAETFVISVYFITNEFDIRGDLILPRPLKVFSSYLLFIYALFRYRILYFYFTGGSLYRTCWLWRIEPFFYKLAGVKTVLMPYGGDVQVMSRSKNLLFKNSMSKDYPAFRTKRKLVEKRVDLWTCYADYIISGCEWVDYMYHWDKLMLAHFSIDTERWKPVKKESSSDDNKLVVLHAPNHRAIKGTQFLIDAVDELIREGYNIELKVVEGVPNNEVKEVMEGVDVVADQFVIGWYAMFALEAMSLEKPVLCYLREDLLELYTAHGLIERNEIPIINTTHNDIKKKLLELYNGKSRLTEIGKKSREFVLKHHSLQAIGAVFDNINNNL